MDSWVEQNLFLSGYLLSKLSVRESDKNFKTIQEFLFIDPTNYFKVLSPITNNRDVLE